ncbi:MAG TPA: SigE family RNA polymerase sigma factor [Candidatus Limnocylindrales bacterium]|nr:SigE family RNA polymerase sigma factor [Candidatus Limnocylindrales bacterium]
MATVTGSMTTLSPGSCNRYGHGVHQAGVDDDHELEYLEYVRERGPWLRKLAYMLAQDWHTADEVAQAAITDLYVHWRRVRSADNLDGYVRRVLINCFLAERRLRWRHRVRLAPSPPERPTAADDPAERVTVRAALSQVPPRQRAVLVLRFYCDLSVQEAADALGCSPGTFKMQPRRQDNSGIRISAAGDSACAARIGICTADPKRVKGSLHRPQQATPVASAVGCDKRASPRWLVRPG